MSEKKKNIVGRIVPVIVILFLVVSSMLLSVYALHWHEYRSDVQELEKICKVLTQKKKGGRVYKPIIGRYLGSKSWIGGPPTHSGSDRVSHKMYLQDRTGYTYNIMAGFHQDRFLDGYIHAVSIVENDAIDKRLDTVEEFGICAWRQDKSGFIGIVESMRKMGI
ncbi:MAG: hypothetical protein ACRBCK_05495 [Alphaproteobacteria bacterium]